MRRQRSIHLKKELKCPTSKKKTIKPEFALTSITICKKNIEKNSKNISQILNIKRPHIRNDTDAHQHIDARSGRD